uniref:Uncharacterized protein n=1 Tax=Trichogramma kaykai TaxID=54128 RepID=A0ABD2XCX8_9HYME
MSSDYSPVMRARFVRSINSNFAPERWYRNVYPLLVLIELIFHIRTYSPRFTYLPPPIVDFVHVTFESLIDAPAERIIHPTWSARRCYSMIKF